MHCSVVYVWMYGLDICWSIMLEVKIPSLRPNPKREAETSSPRADISLALAPVASRQLINDTRRSLRAFPSPPSSLHVHARAVLFHRDLSRLMHGPILPCAEAGPIQAIDALLARRLLEVQIQAVRSPKAFHFESSVRLRVECRPTRASRAAVAPRLRCWEDFTDDGP